MTKRELSPSRERSRARERQRRKLQAECIRRAGGFQKLADSEGKEPVRLFWDGFQWVAKTGASSALLSDPILVNSTRKLRRLYFGNLPLHLGLTETNFQQVVFEEMKRRGFCNNPAENPVLCVWFAKDKGNYGFVEFASVEETERALTMDGMECMGVAVKVSRPNDYCSATQAPGTTGQQVSQQMAANAMIPAIQAGPLTAAIVGSSVVGLAGNTVDSRLVLMKGMVLPSDVEDEAEYNEILEDIAEGCQAACPLIGCAMVTPDIAERDELWDVGDVYVMFSATEGAVRFLQESFDRKYMDRPIRAQQLASKIWYKTVSRLPTAKIYVKEEESLSSSGEGVGDQLPEPSEP